MKTVCNDKNYIHGRGRDSVDARVIKDMIRHHLERTTGGSGNTFIQTRIKHFTHVSFQN